MKMINSPWMSLHAHVINQQDRFLLDIIRPIVLESNFYGQFFFLRYWEGGNHIRIRSNCGDFISKVYEKGNEWVSNRSLDLTIERLPASFIRFAMAAEQKEIINGSDIVPIGIHKSVYFPEYEKYMGPRGVEIAHKVFCASSRSALHGLEMIAMDKKNRLSFAMATTREALLAFDLHGNVAKEWLERHAHRWESLAVENGIIRQGAIAEQASRVAKYISERVNSKIWPQSLSDWHASLIEAKVALLKDCHLFGKGVQMELSLDRFLAQFIHLNANRLGLTLIEECYVVRILAFSFASNSGGITEVLP